MLIDTPIDTGRPPTEEGSNEGRCTHCGDRLPGAAVHDARGQFCCAGCAAAFATIRGLGLDGYYRRRSFDPNQRPMKPDEASLVLDYDAYARDDGDGLRSLSLMIEGLHCAACVWLIEAVLTRTRGVVSARVNMTTRRLALQWQADAASADALAGSINALGYRLVPYDPDIVERAVEQRQRELLKALAVAGFAAGNVMLLSIAVWAGHEQGMGPATRTLLYWVSALLALPAIAYSGRPFFRSAFAVLRQRHMNMDVPISLAILLAAGMSLYQTAVGAEHAYFDSAIGLLFFLLVGRYLDQRARSRARSTAAQLMTLNATAATVIDGTGKPRLMKPSQVRAGMTALIAAGERIAVDGVIEAGHSEIDTSVINGETVPSPVGPGSRVFAGTLNGSGALRIGVSAAGEDTLLAEIARLTEAAEQDRGRYVALADRVAAVYAPAVHILAGATLIGWIVSGAGWQVALFNAIAVLIITCPCALALAVPVVRVVASGRLSRQGILLKSATALERLAAVDTVVFDKTGTLTEGRLLLGATGRLSATDRTMLAQAASIAAVSKHPLARALVRAAEASAVDVRPVGDVREVPGSGLERTTEGGVVRLGSRRFCTGDGDETDAGPELWLAQPGHPPRRFEFEDQLRIDAAEVVHELKARGLGVALLSGDRPPAVATVAGVAGIERWRAGCDPVEKCRVLTGFAEDGRRVLMVGDGLNDAPALAAAHVSMSPSTAVDLARTSADLVFQGGRLWPVVEALQTARRALALIRQNFALAFLYNAVTVPLAMAGLVTPLGAAIAMSASSLLVTTNSLRLNRG